MASWRSVCRGFVWLSIAGGHAFEGVLRRIRDRKLATARQDGYRGVGPMWKGTAAPLDAHAVIWQRDLQRPAGADTPGSPDSPPVASCQTACCHHRHPADGGVTGPEAVLVQVHCGVGFGLKRPTYTTGYWTPSFNGAASSMTRKWPPSQLAVAQRLTRSFSSGSDCPAIGRTWHRCFSFRKYVLVNRFERRPGIANHWTARDLYITITLAGGV